MYAIVDIETTGGYAANNDIIELAIVLHDGKEVKDRFVSLIRTERPIPRFIESLTGIQPAMLQNAPAFNELAPLVAGMLENRVFVAHHVNFDYSFIKFHLEAAGFAFDLRRLCTVRLAKKAFPGMPSYSLGNLCRALDIPIRDRHRAGGDADATALLFQRVMEKGGSSLVESFLRKKSREHYMPSHLDKQQVDQLPYTAGVYYFHDSKDKVIYVGKAINIKYRVLSHFTHNGAGRQRQEFLRNIHRISYQTCVSELSAFILESMEIRKYWPPYNRSQKRFNAVFGLYTYTDQNGYCRLVIDKKKRYTHPLYTFGLVNEGQRLLQQLIRRHKLCPRLCFVQTDDERCIGEEQGYCKGACRAKEKPALYNKRVAKAIASLNDSLPSFAILDGSSRPGFTHCILIERGSFYGMGEVPEEADKNDIKTLKEHLTAYPENEYVRGLIFSHAEKFPESIINF